MIKQTVTQGIVLARTNYQEADRIITLLTPDQGKLRMLAKGVRKSKSKMAGGIELFTISEISFIRGKGELCTLTSSRLIKHFGGIATNINRTMLGYELLKRLHKATEDEPEPAYFELLKSTLSALNEPNIPLELIELWFNAQLLQLGGHSPNLRTDTTNQPLKSEQSYIFSYDDMAFVPNPKGPYKADHIKFLRLVFSDNKPPALAKVQGSESIISACYQLIHSAISNHINL